MMKLSTGQPSTLGSYLKLCELIFGRDSKQTRFIEKKISEHANGPGEEVVVDEGQMLFLLVNLKDETTLDDML